MTEQPQPVRWLEINGIPQVGFLDIDSYYAYPYPNGVSTEEPEDTSTSKVSCIRDRIETGEGKLTAGQLREKVDAYIKSHGIDPIKGPLPTY